MNSNAMVNSLTQIKERVHCYISPVTPEMLQCFLSGQTRGFLTANNKVTFDDYLKSHMQATRSRGWEVRAISVYMEMRENGIPEDEIMQEQVNVEIETWRLLENKVTARY